jgi:hypothetical protein
MIKNERSLSAAEDAGISSGVDAFDRTPEKLIIQNFPYVLKIQSGAH